MKLLLEGTHRARSFADTLAWLAPAAAEAGVTRLANITGLDRLGLPVWTAMRPNSRGLATSQGKGASHEAARVSALMESIESWHAETIDSPLVVADYARIRERCNAFDPGAVPVYGKPPSPDVPLTWMECEELLSGGRCYVPFDCVNTNYVRGTNANGATVFVQSSNGLAGGNTKAEAVLHALAEVLERDAVSASYERIRTFDPALRVRPESIHSAQCRRLLDLLERANMTYALFQLPSDGPAVYACSIFEGGDVKRWRALPPFNGYGCHVRADIALSRAITEAAQSRLTYISGSRDDISASEYARSGNPDDLERYRRLFEDGAARAIFEEAAVSFATFEEDVQWMAGLLRARGVTRIAVADLTKDHLNIPVVKVVVENMAIPGSLVHSNGVRAKSDGRAKVLL